MNSASAGTKITPQEFLTLPRKSQLEQLRRTDASQKAILLIEARHGAELMAALPVQEVHLMVKALGPDQIPEILGMASPEQWTGFLDLECWQGDRIDPARVRFWLALLLEGDDSRVIATLQQISFELLILALKKEVFIMAGPETIEDEDAQAEALKREGGGYQIDYRDEEGAKLYGNLLVRLFNAAPDFCRHLLEAVRAETESLIEESVYQQRSGRLLDLGFPDPFEARSVYAWLDPETFDPEGQGKLTIDRADEELAPGFALALVRPSGLLGEILDAGVDESSGWELACLVNKVAMADGIDVGDVNQIQDVIQKVFGLVNLSLESLAGTDVPAAERIFSEVYCERLFQLGFSLTLQLQRRARALLDSTIGPYLDGTFRALLEPMLERCPRFFEGLEREDRDGSRLFAGLHEVRLCAEWLDLLEIQRRLFEDHFDFELLPPENFELDDCYLDTAEYLTLSEFFLTALANRLLGGPFRPDPVPEQELASLHGMVCREGVLVPELLEETVDWLESLEEGAGGFAEYCLEIWQEEFCDIPPDAMDPRYIGGILVKKTGTRDAGRGTRKDL
jgi:hypothetical protein